MKMLLVLLLALMTGCTSAIKGGGEHDVTIFAVEGLGYGDYVTNGLVAPLQSTYEFNFIRIAWGGECPASYPTGKLIAVGHSLGGPRVLECVLASGREWILVVTLDARVTGQPYKAPPNAKTTINFYQKSLIFPGYPVEGSIQHQVFVGHTELPSLPEVRNVVVDAIRGVP